MVLVAPSTKARLRSFAPRRRSQVAGIRSRLHETDGVRVLGVGRFDPGLAGDLIHLGADIVDFRPGNRDANILTDLAVDGAALAGPYDLVVSQEPGPASTAPDRMLPTLVAALAPGARLVVVAQPDDSMVESLRALDRASVTTDRLRTSVLLEVSIS